MDTNATGGLLDATAVTDAGTVDQQITETDQDGTGMDSAGNSETPGGEDSNYIIEADANLSGDPTVDVTLDTSASGGLLDANVQETSSTGTDSNNSIVEADANVDLSGGSPDADADVAIDPNASGGLLDVNADTQVDLVEQELTSTTGLSIDMGENTIVAESEFGAETGISDAPPAGEAETGLEADIEGIGAGEDLASDPADGLSTTTSTVPGL